MEQLSSKLDNTPTMRGLRAASERIQCKPEELTVTNVNGGYSRNRRALVGFDDSWVFVKEVDTDLLSNDGSEELGWLRKDYACVKALQAKVQELVPEWVSLEADGRVLLMSAYRQEDGWVWGVPESQGAQYRYISAVVAATKKLEAVRFQPVEAETLKLKPFLRDELALDDGLAIMLGDDGFRKRLKNKYRDVLSQSPEHTHLGIHQMIELLDSNEKIVELIDSATKFSQQPETSFGHCDVRSDNIAYNDRTGEVKLVDWNWASYTPKKAGATEFMTDMARRGVDVSDWLNEVDRGMLAAVVGFYAKRCLKDPLFAGSNLREMQAESAAVALKLYSDHPSAAVN